MEFVHAHTNCFQLPFNAPVIDTVSLSAEVSGEVDLAGGDLLNGESGESFIMDHQPCEMSYSLVIPLKSFSNLSYSLNRHAEAMPPTCVCSIFG